MLFLLELKTPWNAANICIYKRCISRWQWGGCWPWLIDWLASWLAVVRSYAEQTSQTLPHPTLAISCTTQQRQNICLPFAQRRPSVFDVGPTFYKCYANVLCLLCNVLEAGTPLRQPERCMGGSGHWIWLWRQLPCRDLTPRFCLLNSVPVNTKHLYNICTMLGQRRRRWPDVVQMLYTCVFACWGV